MRLANREKRIWMGVTALGLLVCCTLAALATGLPEWVTYTCEGTNFTLGLYSLCDTSDNCQSLMDSFNDYPGMVTPAYQKKEKEKRKGPPYIELVSLTQ